jgi:hypothetical protein
VNSSLQRARRLRADVVRFDNRGRLRTDGGQPQALRFFGELDQVELAQVLDGVQQRGQLDARASQQIGNGQRPALG